MQHVHHNIQHLQLAEGGPNIFSAYGSVIFLSRRLVCYESGDLKICDIGADIRKSMLCCLLLTTVNCGEHPCVFKPLAEFRLADLDGLAAQVYVALLWFKKSCGLQFSKYIVQLLRAFEYMLLYQQQHPFFSTLE